MLVEIEPVDLSTIDVPDYETYVKVSYADEPNSRDYFKQLYEENEQRTGSARERFTYSYSDLVFHYNPKKKT